jgi:uncharacterized protein (UPF0276 family)
VQFAINYSPQAADLLREGRIQLDRFKSPNWQDLLCEAQALLPVYVHFSLVAGRGGLERLDWDAMETILKETDTPYINLHLASVAGDQLDITDQSLTAEQRQRVIDQMHVDIGLVVKRFGAKRVIVENIPYLNAEDSILRRHLLPTCVEPEVINIVLEEANCGFLFDISHARISAKTLGIDEKVYIEALPLHRVRELHVTGIETVNGQPEDHMPMADSDWEMLEWVLGKIVTGEMAQPWIVSFEYGGIGELFEWRSKPDVIAIQVPRLYDIVHAVQV